jgi:hypothetical protein
MLGLSWVRNQGDVGTLVGVEISLELVISFGGQVLGCTLCF